MLRLRQQAHFEYVPDARPQFRKFKRFADEIPSAGLERTQVVTGLGGDHEDRKIAVPFDFFQALHYLEPIHAGHLEIQEDQAIAILAVESADLVRVVVDSTEV